MSRKLMPRRKQRKTRMWWIVNSNLGGRMIEYGGHKTRKAAIQRFLLHDTIYAWAYYRKQGYTCEALEDWMR